MDNLHLLHVGGYWLAIEHISGFYMAADGIISVILDEGENGVDIHISSPDYDSFKTWIELHKYNWKADIPGSTEWHMKESQKL